MPAAKSAAIEVRPLAGSSPPAFEVAVREGGGASMHRVTLAPEDHARLSSAHTPEQVIEAAFRFLLEREPKESILGRFDLTEISRFFPEFESALPDYLEPR